MNTDHIRIYIDRLANEGEFEQDGVLPASILELDQREVESSDIDYKLKAYIADDHLVINFDASCTLKLPCKICNEKTTFDVKCMHQTLLEPLTEVKKGVFEATRCIREQILLSIPPFIECGGNCPEREFVKKFLKSQDTDTETYKPFQGL